MEKEKPEIIIIVASSMNRVIGKDNDLPWHLPVDMQFFKEQTAGYPVIMGRKNYESIPDRWRPLPGRKNIVLSRRAYRADHEAVEVFQEIETAIDCAKEEGKNKIFIVGGGQIYDLALQRGVVDKMLITWVNTELEGHAHFPEFDEKEWDKQTLMSYSADKKHAYDMKMVEYRKK